MTYCARLRLPSPLCQPSRSRTTVVGAFRPRRRDEGEIREIADALYRRVDLRWAQNGALGLSQGWKRESGFLHYSWEGYSEAGLLYVLGLGSPTFPLTPAAYVTWQLTYQWENLMGRDVLYSGPLFTHLFSHAWIDFRGIRDAFMRERPATISRIRRAPLLSIANTANAIPMDSRPIAAISGALRQETVQTMSRPGLPTSAPEGFQPFC